MSDHSDTWVPLSVKRGIREPFLLVEGIPEHARPAIDDWVETVLGGVRDTEKLIRFITSSLRLQFHVERPYHVTDRLRARMIDT